MNNKLKQVLKFIFVNHLYIMPLLFIIDIISKFSMEALLLSHGGKIEVIKGFFAFELVYNPGSFSGFLGNIPYGTFILMCLSIIGGVIAIIYFVKHFKTMNIITRIALYLLIPGCFGNMFDRFLKVINVKEGVIDFLSFNLPLIGPFPVFNFADICLTIAMFLILFSLLYEEIIKDKKTKKEELNSDKSITEIYNESTSKDEK